MQIEKDRLPWNGRSRSQKNPASPESRRPKVDDCQFLRVKAADDQCFVAWKSITLNQTVSDAGGRIQALGSGIGLRSISSGTWNAKTETGRSTAEKTTLPRTKRL